MQAISVATSISDYSSGQLVNTLPDIQGNMDTEAAFDIVGCPVTHAPPVTAALFLLLHKHSAVMKKSFGGDAAWVRSDVNSKPAEKRL
jgi:hypothetical protein